MTNGREEERGEGRDANRGTSRALQVFAVTAADDGSTVARWLRRRYPHIPFGLLQKLLRTRRIEVEGQRVRTDHRLNAGEKIEIRADLSGFEKPADAHLRRAMALRGSPRFRRSFHVLYEDDALIAVDKPAGWVVHPSRGHHGGDTLLDLLAAHLPESFAPGSPYRPAFVHRLDQGTSGVIVAAKSRESARRLEAEFRGGRVRKRYLALVRGSITLDEGTLEASIARSETRKGYTRFRASHRDEPDDAIARPAETVWRVRERFRRATLLEIEPTTGRTHQIRVHLAGIGNPILGDGDYGNKEANRAYRERHRTSRLFLHAERLELVHPLTNAPLSIEAPPASELERILDELRSR